MKNEFRRNITHQAREIRQLRFTPSNDAVVNKEHILYSPEVDHLWKDKKPEFYALSAVLIDHSVTQALHRTATDPRFGFIYRQNNFHEFETEIRDYLNQSSYITSTQDYYEAFPAIGTFVFRIIDDQLSRDISLLEETLIDSSATHPLKAVYQRYKDLYNFSEKYEVYDKESRREQDDSPIHGLRRGLRTATNTMSELLEITPKLLEKELLESEVMAEMLCATAKNSFPVIGELAMSNLRLFVTFRSAFSESFELRQHKNGYSVTLTEGALKKEFEQKQYYQLLKTRPYDLVNPGCPAMVNFGEGSAISRLWELHIDLARPIYESMYPHGSECNE